ncbi:hypothetical protein MKW98_010987 [Papaver atlanticum]|uniref:Uncharacterized protein n=1 Tax=Papaver atlanticum TaxID=357466 RepID=A0AAD4TKN4_9MAGN|nr:hypothetical protein MKW98_010987 [Papaver atlanticum]
MVYSYTPTYYSSIHDTITSLCKNIIPFSSASLKKRRLQSADQKLSKQQSDNLKWQQESFHKILNLIGLKNEGIIQEIEVSNFRIQLLETLITAPPTLENATIVRDKLLFLQELFYAKCISVEEYHSSKRPLLQRLAVQGAEIEARDVIVARRPSLSMENHSEKPEQDEEEEKWSVIDFKDDESSLMGKENQNQNKNKNKRSPNPMKERIRGGAASMIGLLVSKKGKKSEQTDQLLGGGGFPFPANSNSDGNGGERYEENPFWEDKENDSRSILMQHENRQQLPTKTDQLHKKKPFANNWFRQREQIKQEEEENRDFMVKNEKKNSKLRGFDVGLHKWDRINNLGDEEEMDDDKCTTPLTKSKY